jgi:lipopolysaccharide/colanic/teichoic acid biosynthesis glycosyltransferase
MPQGYPGLANRQAEHALAAEEDMDLSVSASAGRTNNKIAPLHVVEFDRRISRPALSASESRPTRDVDVYACAKRTFDVLGACIAVVVFSPFLLLIVFFLIASGESPFFRHRRVGRGGVLFDCLKFRTMVTDADRVLEDLLNCDGQFKEEWLRGHKLKYDPRVTRIGRLLRRTSLDELPQLWNVLRGEMSLVGPRPVVPEELWHYGRKKNTLLSARPGITGLWQVSGRNNTDYPRRVALDIFYVRSRSLVLDLYILVKTFSVVCTASGAY